MPTRFINLLILGVMSVVCGVVDSILEQRLYPTGAPWLFGDTQKDDNPKINGLVTWAFALITWVLPLPLHSAISIDVPPGSKTSYPYRSIFLSNSYGLARPRSSGLIQRWYTRRRGNPL